MKKSDIFWQTYLSLEKEFINVSNFIFITDEITTHEHGKEITNHVIPNWRRFHLPSRFAYTMLRPDRSNFQGIVL